MPSYAAPSPRLPLSTSTSNYSPISPQTRDTFGRFALPVAGNSPISPYSTSSLRDPPPNATPPAPSRSPSAAGRGGEAGAAGSSDERDDRRKGKGRERDDGADDELRPEKRSRVSRGSRHEDSPAKVSASGPSPPADQASGHKSRALGLAPIKPIGFAASREARRDDGNERAIPSPVVMGFDFKSIDEDQLKTVRDTISIKEQQQALIAQRRKEMAASQPTTPRELTFKGWTPKDSEKRSVGARRERTREKVERMSIVTSAGEKDVVPGSKSAPLNQGLASQQQSPREPPSGSQTAMPQHHLPPLHYPSHPHTAHHMPDPRTAMSHPRSARPEGGDFAQQQQPYYQAQQQAQQAPHRSSLGGGPPSSRAADGRYPPDLGPRSGRQPPPPQPGTADRRTFSVPSLQHPNSAHPSNLYPPSPHGLGPQSATRPSNGGHRRANGYSMSPSPPNHMREQFLAPFSQLYDMLSSVDGLRYQLQDMIHRSEQSYASQMQATNEFKTTAAQASGLLASLQQSADSLKEMVRYEVDRAGSSERREVDDLRDRIRALEERLSHK